MLTFSRQLAKQIRAVFRRALQISASQTDQVVWLVGDESGLRFRARNWRAIAEHHLSGVAATESMPLTMEALAACEGTKSDELVTVERGSDGMVVLRWTDRSIPQSFQLDAQKIRADQTPASPEAWSSNPPRLLKALNDAMTIAASDATLYAINCVQLRPDGGRIAATDSHQLLIEAGFHVPGNTDVLVPRTTLFGCRELPTDQPLDVGVTADHGVFRVGAWTFWLTLEKQGRFPNVENIIPAADTAKTRLILSVEDVSYFLDIVPRLPTETDQEGRITLDLNGRVALLAKGDGPAPVTQVVLRNSQRTGDELRLNTERRFLVHAAQLGFRELELCEPESPIVCRDERRLYLWSVLADGPALEAGPDAVQLESPLATHSHRRARAVPPPRRAQPTPERNSSPMPRHRITETFAGSAPSTANSPPPSPKTNGEHDSSGTFNAILQQAETAKTSLHDAFSQMNHLIGLLKRHRRQSKLMQSTLASLKQLQTLDV